MTVKSHVLVVGIILGVAIAGGEARAESPEPDESFRFHVGWDRGITYEYHQHLKVLDDLGAPSWVDDLALKGRIGGSLYLDGGWVGGDDTRDGLAGAVRRARLYTSGEILHWVDTEYKFEFAIDDGRFFLNDFYLRWRPDRYVDTVRIGYFDPPASLQNLVASGSRVLMEVASPVAAFTPGFRLGLEVSRAHRAPSLSWCLNLSSVGQEADVGIASDEALRLFGRIVWRPFGEPSADAPLLHLGLSASFAPAAGDTNIRYRSRPESFLLSYLVDTEDIEGSGGVVGVEAAWRRGSLIVQGEGFVASVDGDEVGTRVFYGVYLQAGYALTGEVRGYSEEHAVFQRLAPKQPFRRRGPGLGALELAARLSWVDLSDGSVEGGRMLSFTVGPAWTWNRYVRILAGYVVADVSDRPDRGTRQILQARLELAF